MPQPLIAPWTLITDTWRTFIKTWETTVRISVWFIAVGAISALGPFMRTDALGFLTILLLDVVGVAIALWASVRLYQTVLAIERGQPVTDKTTATAVALIWPVFLVQLLTGISVIGGFILLIIPGIYVGVRLVFSQLTVIDPTAAKRWTAALKESWALTKGKFWPIFGRILLGSLLFGILVGITISLATSLVGLIAGPNEFYAAMSSENQPPALTAAIALIQGIVQAALIALAPIFQVKLYESVKRAQ